MDGWMDKKMMVDGQNRWMVGWIKKWKKKIDGWLDGQKKYMKKDGWLDG